MKQLANVLDLLYIDGSGFAPLVDQPNASCGDPGSYGKKLTLITRRLLVDQYAYINEPTLADPAA